MTQSNQMSLFVWLMLKFAIFLCLIW
jgi:hypothetical protein